MKNLKLVLFASFIALFTSCTVDESFEVKKPIAKIEYQAEITYTGASAEVWVNSEKKSFNGKTAKLIVKQGDMLTILVQGLYLDNTNNYGATNVSIDPTVTLKLDNIEVERGGSHLYHMVY